MTLPVPPPALQTCINSSCAKYGIPVDILVGVWIKESGGSFPNDAVNSSGYGGLFGTTDWNGPTQEQSDYAASILRNLHNQYGTWALMLYHYSGGGYTTVPGQTTFDGDIMTPEQEAKLDQALSYAIQANKLLELSTPFTNSAGQTVPSVLLAILAAIKAIPAANVTVDNTAVLAAISTLGDRVKAIEANLNAPKPPA